MGRTRINGHRFLNSAFSLVIFGYLFNCAKSQCIFGEDDACAFHCHCASGSMCDQTTGKCLPDKCAIGRSDGVESEARWSWHGPGCQTGNVALGKKAISNDHSAVMGAWVADNDMTDGRTRSTTKNCPVIWTMANTPAAWLIDLGKPHSISTIEAYVFNENAGKLRATVGNSTSLSEHTTCSVMQNTKKLKRNRRAQLICEVPLVGQYISIVKDPDLNDNVDTLELCEIAAIGHVYYDVNWSSCMDTVFNGIWCMQCLDSQGPDCKTLCDKGRHGINCALSCEPCNGSCNPNTGQCDESIKPKVDKKESIGTKNIPELVNVTDTKQSIDDIVFVTQKVFTGEISKQKPKKNKPKNTFENDEVSTNYDDEVGAYEDWAHEGICDSGYFGENCDKKCGACLNGKACDSRYGSCLNGCEDWYVDGEISCDTYLPKVDIIEKNVIVYPTPYALKVKLYGVASVPERIEGFYKGEVRYISSAKDGNQVMTTQKSDIFDEDNMLIFYPTNGSFLKELTISGLNEDTMYEINIMIFRVHHGKTEPGADVTLTAKTTVAKAIVQPQSEGSLTKSYTFIILVTGFSILIVCVVGVVIVFACRTKRRKSDITISDIQSHSPATPIGLTKIEPDPIYQFIDDGADPKFHVYHDIDDIEKATRKNQLWSDPTRMSKDDYTGAVHLITRPPFLRHSYSSEPIENIHFRRVGDNMFTVRAAELRSAANNGYLTTDLAREAPTQGNNRPQGSLPRYVKTSHGMKITKNISAQDKCVKSESDYLLPVSQTKARPKFSPAETRPTYSHQGALQHSHQEYMVPNNMSVRPGNGYIPMDTQSLNSFNFVNNGRRSQFSCLTSTPVMSSVNGHGVYHQPSRPGSVSHQSSFAIRDGYVGAEPRFGYINQMSPS